MYSVCSDGLQVQWYCTCWSHSALYMLSSHTDPDSCWPWASASCCMINEAWVTNNTIFWKDPIILTEKHELLHLYHSLDIADHTWGVQTQQRISTHTDILSGKEINTDGCLLTRMYSYTNWCIQMQNPWHIHVLCTGSQFRLFTGYVHTYMCVCCVVLQ